MDYCIHGPCLQLLGDVLDVTKSVYKGELGMTQNLYEQLVPSAAAGEISRNVDGCAILTEAGVLLLFNLLESQISSILTLAVESDTKQVAAEIPGACTSNSDDHTEKDAAFQMLELFVNQALLRKLRYGKESQVFPLINPVPSHQLSRTLTAPAPKTIKVTSEFRVVSVVFVKLLSPFESQKAQTVMAAFVKILKKSEGFFQQYSVDDKGQSMLAVFGLPPLTHEKDPLNALKAALDFEDFCERNSKSVGKVAIAVATDALGDVVNVAARLMSLPIPNATVRCDKATFNITKQDVHLTSLGLHKVKGKIEPVEIWTVSSKVKRNGKRDPFVTNSNLDMVGYLNEREILRSSLGKWASDRVSQKIVVEGPSGVGKSQPQHAKLLEDVLPVLKSEENEERVSQMDSQTRFFLVKQMVVRMVKASLTLENYVIILDDSQGRKLPLYLDLIADSLKNDFQNFFEIDANGELGFKGKEVESKLSSLATFSSSIMAQFDRLDASMQGVLLKASILGQYFSLEDLSALFKGEKSVTALENVIEAFDTFRYLIKQESDSPINHPYYFRHIQLMQQLYNSQSYEDRSSAHLESAIHYENSLDGNNRERLLPIVAYHYRRTGNIEKQIIYLEELSLQNFRKGHAIASISFLESLVDLATQNADRIHIQDERKAKWLALLSLQQVSASIYTVKQYEMAALALNLIGAGWPKDSEEVGKAVMKSGMALYRLWKATKGGTRKLPESTDFFGNKRKLSYYNVPANDSIAETMMLAYRSIFRMASFTTLIDKKSTLKVESLIVKESDKEDLRGYYQYKGYHLAQKVKFKEALIAFDIALRYFTQRGDMSNKIVSMSYLSVVGIFSGDITSYEDTLWELSKERDSFQIVHLMLLTHRKMVTVDMQETKRRHHLAKEVAKEYPPNVMIDGTILTHASWISYQEGTVDKSLEFFESASTKVAGIRFSALPSHNAVLVLGLLSWMLCRPCIPNHCDHSKHNLSMTEKNRLLAAVNEILKTTILFVEKCKLRILYLAHVILKSNRLHLLNKRKKSMRLLLSTLKSRMAIEIMDEMKPGRAYIFSILALHSENETDRQHYLREAVKMYQQFG
ncbi:hypothetical protein HDV05_003961, partial [Chytridiales sp. JEL 0842]